MPTTILDSISQRLPHIDCESSDYRRISASSESTIQTRALFGFMSDSASALYPLGDDFEAKRNNLQYLQTAKNRVLGSRGKKPAACQDVVRASVQQLINPVNIAFEDLYLGDKIL